ncbi:MAG: hypothetical protein Kow0037_21170 [Calditrichia bacterium]
MKWRFLILFWIVFALGSGWTQPPQYSPIQQKLQQGWNTWDSRSVLRQVHLPDAAVLQLSLKQTRWLNEPYLETALIGRYGEEAEKIRPGYHAVDGRYTQMEFSWQGVILNIESAAAGDTLLWRIIPNELPQYPTHLILSGGFLWNRPGTVKLEKDGLTLQSPLQQIRVFISGEPLNDYYIRSMTPYQVRTIQDTIIISTHRQFSRREADEFIRLVRKRYLSAAEKFGEDQELYLALEAGLAWNTVFEPRHDRVVSTVGRLWNEEYGGYCLFGWDNFFLSYVSALFSRELAIANMVEHLNSRTAEGFIPNDDRGNGSKSFDRSQPPVGALMLKELLKINPEKWLLEWAYPILLDWNRWWFKRRLNEGLLSYGSHPAPNPYFESNVHNRVAAGYESGMDDSPMYEGVPFNPDKNVLELQDVGLTALIMEDCEILMEMARLLGREDDYREIRARLNNLEEKFTTLWNDSLGLYLNRRTDTDEWSFRLSPTLFYPLFDENVPEHRKERIVKEHLLNPAEFWGEYLLPSIARNDPEFPRQRYWRGAIWPPLNFLTYLALRQAGFQKEAAILAEKSADILLGEWRRQGYISENYSAISGTGDDARLSSDRFHSWGTLMGIMKFIERGHLPVVQTSVKMQSRRNSK